MHNGLYLRPRVMECESFEWQLGMNDLMSAYGMMHRLIQHHATSCHPMLGWLTRRERFQVHAERRLYRFSVSWSHVDTIDRC